MKLPNFCELKEMHLDTRISLYIRAKTGRSEEKNGQSGERKKEKERGRRWTDRTGICAPRALLGEDVQRLCPRARRIRVTDTFPSAFHPRGLPCFILVHHPVTRSLSPLPFSSHSLLFSSRLIPPSVSIEMSYRLYEERGEENQHRCILADATFP